MDEAKKKEVLSGLRLGVSLGGFLIGGMLMGNGLGRIVGPERIVWESWSGWAELVVAAGILFLTASTWLMLLGGYLVLGALKGFFLFATGTFPSRGFSTRVEALAVVLYCVATLVLMFRFVEDAPTALDKIALTVYVFCLWPAAANSAFSWWQGVGLAGLFLSWVFSRWCSARDKDNVQSGGSRFPTKR